MIISLPLWDDDKALINQQIRNWKFSCLFEGDRHQHVAVQAAALFLREHAENFPAEAALNNPTNLTILAIKVYGVFLEGPGKLRQIGQAPSDNEIVKAILKAKEKFEARRLIRSN